MSFETFVEKMDIGKRCWIEWNKAQSKGIYNDLSDLNFPEFVPASVFSKHVGAANTKGVASIFGYSKLNNPRNKSGKWPNRGFIYTKDAQS